MGKQIFYAQYCDEWVSNDSLSLCFIGTSKRKLKMFISRCIEKGEMNYSHGEELNPKQQAKLFREDWENLRLSEINNYLEYGYIDYTHDNEEI